MTPEERKPGDKKKNPHIQIGFHKKDEELVNYIEEKIGGIRIKENNTIRLS